MSKCRESNLPCVNVKRVSKAPHAGLMAVLMAALMVQCWWLQCVMQCSVGRVRCRTRWRHWWRGVDDCAAPAVSCSSARTLPDNCPPKHEEFTDSSNAATIACEICVEEFPDASVLEDICPANILKSPYVCPPNEDQSLMCILQK